MVANSNSRWAYGLLLLALAVFAALSVILAFVANSDSETVSKQCVPHHEVNPDYGEHGGRPWRINASIEKIERHGGCSYWFLKVQFLPQGVAPGSWTEGWGISAAGHLRATATIDASEEEEGQAIGGVVGSRVHSVILSISGARMVVVHPKDPRPELFRRFMWLHGLRYFIYFFRAGEHVRAAKLFDAKGNIISTVHSREGEVVGFMGA
jgi:hypothetical protein